MPLLDIENLYKHFPVRKGVFLREQGRASVINGVSLQIEPGEIVGVVGESGCGKSTLARLIMRILPASGGELRYSDAPIDSIPKSEYYRQVQMIFQDPFSSLNPKMTVEATLNEMIRLHQPEKDLSETRRHLLEEVGMPNDAEKKYPHEFSGGQRQRIAIARALAAAPTLLIADEPVSALDVSIQAQILNLLKDLQQRHRLSLMFISHDLEIVDYFCDRILVMYLGKIVETFAGSALHSAQHPYSQALLRSMPSPEKRKQGIEVLHGELPSPLQLPTGCAFFSRCEKRSEQCRQVPPLESYASGHQVACWNVNKHQN